MVKHVVMWRLHEGARGKSAKDNAVDLKGVLDALPSHIPEIISFDVGINEIPSDATCDISLYSTFESYETLTAYKEHPEHQKVVDLLQEMTKERYVVDYED